MQTLPCKNRRLEDNSLADWKPVKCRENRHDMVITTSAGDQTSCCILHRLKATKMKIGGADQHRVAVVQVAAHKGLDYSTCRIGRQ